MRFKISILVLLFAVFTAGYMQFGNSQDSSIRHEWENSPDTNNPYVDIEEPPTKIPPISMNAGPLLRALLERVWVTKYFGAPAEIYKVPSEMPLCEAMPASQSKQDAKNGVFLWQQKCLPLEIRWDVNREDLSGVGTLRMLDFDKVDKVLEDAFEVIRANSLGSYKIEEAKKDTVKNLIIDIKNFHIENPGSRYFETIFGNYKDSLETYPILEGRYFLEDGLIGSPDVTDDFEEKKEEIRKYFAHRARKYALTIGYEPKAFTRKGNIIEYTLTAPAGFFGMEKDYKKAKMK